jgi:riboflavin kinase/FMN adenylyltransferase
MRIINSLFDLNPADRGASAAIGNFDGVHLGHQVLIRDAAAQDGTVAVVTFEPHPRRFFQPEAPPFRLTTQAEKARVLARHGVELLVNIGFDADLAAMEAEDFMQEVLHDKLGLSHVTVGSDFRFGKGRKGDAAMLRAMGPDLGFGVTIQELVGDEAGDFASTALRELVIDGRCEEAARQLGRWHTVSGPVVQGDQRGRDLGYPTANLAFGDQLIPRYGIYAARVEVLDGPHAGTHDAVVSIGERPTFGINAPNFEAHIFDFQGNLYGTEISVGLVRYLRGEVAFEGVDELIKQMNQDSDDARAALAVASIPV